MPPHCLPKRVLSLWVILLALLVPCRPLPAQESPETEALARRLQHVYAGLTSLTFDFQQVTRTGGRERSGQGNAVFYKPLTTAGKPEAGERSRSVMRWNYTEPDRQVIINDGRTLSIYTEKDQQLIRTPAKELESDITYAFFAGTRNLLDDFEAQAPAEEVLASRVGAPRTLLLVPRTPHNQIKSVQIWLDERDIIQRLLLTDHFDAETELLFSRIMLNSLPPDDPRQIEEIISFQPPAGTEVITR
ncbi:MAG: LolA family protein [Thermodesulfobacteriota bacterium]